MNSGLKSPDSERKLQSFLDSLRRFLITVSSTSPPNYQDARDEKRLKLKTIFVISCILAVGLFLRLLGLSVGLPSSPEPRESLIANEVRNLINFSGPPQIYNWPGTAWFYLIALAGKFLSIVGFHLTDARVILLARFLNTLLSTATIWFTYRLGTCCYNKRSGQIAAGFLAVAMLHATNESRFALVDIPATFCVTLFLWLLMRNGASLQRKTLVWLGIVAGIGFSVKFTTAFGVLSALLFICTTHLRTQWHSFGTQPVLTADIKKSLVTMIGVSMITFTFICPYWLIDFVSPTWNFFFEDFWYEATHYQRGHFGLFTTAETGAIQRLTYLWTLLKWGMGFPLALLVSISILYAFVIAKPRESAINRLIDTSSAPTPLTIQQVSPSFFEKQKWATRMLLVFIIPYLLFIGMHKVKFARHLLIIYPVLTVLAGAMLAQLQNIPIRVISRIFLGGAVAIYSLVYTAAFASVLLSQPTRVEAAEWIEANIPSDESISCTPEILFPWLLPEFTPELKEPDAEWALILVPNAEVFQKYASGQGNDTPDVTQISENSDWYPLEAIDVQHVLTFYAPILGEDLSLLQNAALHQENAGQEKYELRKIFRRTPQFLGIRISDTGAPFPMHALAHPEIRLYRRAHSLKTEK